MTIALSWQAEALLTQLVALGLYGETPEAVAVRLLDASLIPFLPPPRLRVPSAATLDLQPGVIEPK